MNHAGGHSTEGGQFIFFNDQTFHLDPFGYIFHQNANGRASLMKCRRYFNSPDAVMVGVKQFVQIPFFLIFQRLVNDIEVEGQGRAHRFQRLPHELLTGAGKKVDRPLIEGNNFPLTVNAQKNVGYLFKQIRVVLV